MISAWDKIPKAMNPLWQNYTNWKKTFQDVVYTCHDSLIFYIFLYKIMAFMKLK